MNKGGKIFQERQTIKEFKPIKFDFLGKLNLFLNKLVAALGRFFAACIILVAIAHFVPKLRESMPQLYLFIDSIVFKVINWAYGLINSILL